MKSKIDLQVSVYIIARHRTALWHELGEFWQQRKEGTEAAGECQKAQTGC